MLYRISHFIYDDSNGVIKKDDCEIQLTKTQRRLFNYFIKNPKTTVSKETLMVKVWDRVVTKNTIERTLSILRSNIEIDSGNPKLLITHFGHGVSLEVDAIPLDLAKTKNKKLSKTLIITTSLFILTLLAFFKFYPVENKTDLVNNNIQTKFDFDKKQSLLVMPTIFEGIDNTLLEDGSNELVKNTINSFNSKNQIIFEDKIISPEEIMEKNWLIDKELVIIKTKVVKNGNIYDAVMQFTKGYDTIKTVNLSANSLTELTNLQLQSVSHIHNKDANLKKLNFVPKTNEEKYLQALGYKKNKNYEKAKQLLKQILAKDETSYLARFSLADVLLDQKKFDESLAQLITLKSTPLYETRGGSIEFLSSIILSQKNENRKLIDNVDSFLSSHNGIVSNFNKGKLLLQKAAAHMILGDMSEALKQYKLCIVGLDEHLYPDVFASSYLGQATILSMNSSDDTVIDLFYKALSYAEKQDNLRIQIAILNALSLALYSKNKWQEGIAVIKKSISLMDAENTDGITDKSDVAYGLSVLSLYLYERGLFNDAKTVLDRLEKTAKNLESDDLYLVYYHHLAYLNIYRIDYDIAKTIIDKQYELAVKTSNYAYQLNNSFIQLELLIQTNNINKFKKIYDERIKLFEPESLERYKIYMYWFLARSYVLLDRNEEAIKILNTVSEQALSFQDTKLFVDAQVSLSKCYINSNPEKALDILNNISQYNPNSNPYLWVKAKILVKLNRKLDALTTLNLAKPAFNEAWSAKNQELLNKLKNEIENSDT